MGIFTEPPEEAREQRLYDELEDLRQTLADTNAAWDDTREALRKARLSLRDQLLVSAIQGCATTNVPATTANMALMLVDHILKELEVRNANPTR